MVICCCAVGCSNRQGRPGKRFFAFPKDKKQRDKWIAAVKREKWVPSRYSRLCSDHFVSGKSAILNYFTGYVPITYRETISRPSSS